MRDTTRYHLWGLSRYILGMAAPVALSAVGAAYFGFRGAPYRAVIIWALISTAVMLWLARRDFVRVLTTNPYAVTEQDIRDIRRDGEARGWSPQQIADAVEDERYYRENVLQAWPSSAAQRLRGGALIIAAVAAAFIVGDSLVYWLVS